MPTAESKRVALVNRFLNLKSTKEKELKNIVIRASQICNTAFSYITLISENKEHVLYSNNKIPPNQNRENAFCNTTIQYNSVMIVSDALENDNFINNPNVIGEPYIRFYAGMPLTSLNGCNVGALCVFDVVPGNLNSDQQLMLELLSKQVTHLLEFDLVVNSLKNQFDKSKEAATKLRAFFESSISCHLLIGKNQEVLDFNKSIAKLIKTRYNVTIKVGIDVMKLVNKSFREEFISHYQSALAGVPVRMEKNLKDEKMDYWWSINFDPAYDSQGKLIGVCYNAIDISEIKKKQESLLKKNEVLREIAWIESHEVRRPLASILGLIEMLKDLYSDPEIKEILEMVIFSGGELDAMIRRVNERILEVAE